MQEAQKTNQSIVKLFTSLDQFSQNLKINEFDQNFNENNLAISIVNMPNNRTKPIIGFAFGKNIEMEYAKDCDFPVF
jgi:hypothetical protein